MKEYKFIKRTQHLFKSGDIVSGDMCLLEWITEGRVVEINPEPKVEKEEVVVDPIIEDRIKDFAEDLKDDGKRNRSNKKPKKGIFSRKSKSKR